MSIYINQEDDLLVLDYMPDFGQEDIERKIENNNHVKIKKVFYFEKDDLHNPNIEDLSDSNDGIKFVLGNLDGDYFRIQRRILNTNNDVFIHRDVYMTEETFIGYRGVSVFRILNRIMEKDIYVGGGHQDAIAEKDFKNLLKKFPKAGELDYYVVSRIESVLSEYFDVGSIFQVKYNKHLKNKLSRENYRNDNFINLTKENDLIKYKSILDELESMIANSDGYDEAVWQSKIINIILLLYPKYINYFTNVPVKDCDGVDKFIDIALIDANGHIDIIEIKKPFDNKIVTEGLYRNNHIPLREMSGSIMQAEKYIYYLNRQGIKGEERLTDKYRNKLPKSLEIKITNPQSIIIMGRDNNLTSRQKGDFEVIRRKYKNVIDIVTYDDLIRRLKNIIEAIDNRN